MAHGGIVLLLWPGINSIAYSRAVLSRRPKRPMGRVHGAGYAAGPDLPANIAFFTAD